MDDIDRGLATMKFVVEACNHSDWKTERERIDIASVATNLLGPALRRRHGRMWWRCPLGTHEGIRPKYHEAFRDRRWPAGIYPGPHVVRPGRPVIVTEGDFDALLLGQVLGELASVVTLGSASARPDPGLLNLLLPACPWFIATDADDAGERAAAAWLGSARARRIRPPGSYKDWTAAHRGGVILRRWWGDVLAGNDRPAPFTQDELAARRWGPALDDPTPGIVVDEPDRMRMRSAMQDNRDDPEGDGSGPLGALLTRLAERGLRIDGELAHPRVAVGTATGRVTYSGIDPPPQGIAKAERPRRIGPVVEGRVFVRADYGQVEPRILLAILRRRSLITWVAGADLYRDLIADASIGRDAAKVMVNRIINGGRPAPGAAGRLAGFIAAAESYRAELAADARARGAVETLAGRRIPLAAGEDNHGGKAVNRVVQGTAADVFNRAAVAVGRTIDTRGLPAAVAFLLFDELWVECDPATVALVEDLVRAEMEAAALADGVTVPVQFTTE